MTSNLATNSRKGLDSMPDFAEYLEVKRGTQIPLEGQVQLTYETAFSLTNGASSGSAIFANGYNVSYGTAATAGGDSTVTLTAAQATNLIGRRVVLAPNCTGANDLLIVLPAGWTYRYQGQTTLTYNSLEFPSTCVSAIELVFTDASTVIVLGDVATFTFA
jgi:hypothetical protein